jgi:hypothetical protein
MGQTLLLALAAVSIALRTSAVKRGTILPFASPFDSLGRPASLAVLGCLKVSKLLQNGGFDCIFCCGKPPNYDTTWIWIRLTIATQSS